MISSDVQALLEGPNIAHVATLGGDGAPHSVPVWVGLEGDRIAILTSPKSQKARNLGRDPRVAISITDRDQPIAMASIRGRVIDVIRGEPAWEIIDRVSNKYVGQPYPRDEERIELGGRSPGANPRDESAVFSEVLRLVDGIEGHRRVEVREENDEDALAEHVVFLSSR